MATLLKNNFMCIPDYDTNKLLFKYTIQLLQNIQSIYVAAQKRLLKNFFDCTIYVFGLFYTDTDLPFWIIQ